MTFTETMEHVAQLFEAIGAVVLLVGLFVCVGLAIRSWIRWRDGRRAYKVLRESFGGVILLGLEILVAADLIRTVAVAPTLENVAILGLIVLISTFLSFSLEIEIELPRRMLARPPRILMTGWARELAWAGAPAGEDGCDAAEVLDWVWGAGQRQLSERIA